jgi:hypothetical protein
MDGENYIMNKFKVDEIGGTCRKHVRDMKCT